MPPIIDKVTRLARSPQGKRAVERAQRFARDPKTKRRIAASASAAAGSRKAPPARDAARRRPRATVLGRAQALRVPLPRPPQPVVEGHPRLPAQLGANRRRVQVLAVDLAVRRAGAANVRLDLPAGDRD